MASASAQAPRSKSPPSEARSTAPTHGRVGERREHRASPALREAVPAPRTKPIPREACKPPPRALEGELLNSARRSADLPQAPERWTWLRTRNPERPPLATERRSIGRSPRAAARETPSPPKPLLAAEPRSPQKQLSTKDKSNTIAFTCGLRRAGGAGPRRADRCNGLLDFPNGCSPRKLDRRTRTNTAVRYLLCSSP